MATWARLGWARTVTDRYGRHAARMIEAGVGLSEGYIRQLIATVKAFPAPEDRAQDLSLCGHHRPGRAEAGPRGLYRVLSGPRRPQSGGGPQEPSPDRSLVREDLAPTALGDPRPRVHQSSLLARAMDAVNADALAAIEDAVAAATVARFTVAVDRPFAKEGQQDVDFIDCVAWRWLGETVAKFMTKGRLVAVEGHLAIRSYETQEGDKRRVAEIVCDNVRFLDSKKGDKAPASEEEEAEIPADLPF